MWGEDRAAPLSIRTGHEGLEGFPEHLWVDGRLDPIRALFTRRESVAREHLAEEFAHLLIRKEHAAERALVRRAREEAAVQERDAAEGTCRRGASRIARVESAEKKREQHAPVEVSTGLHARVEGASEESAIRVQPSLGLEKAKKEQTGGIEQRELAPLGRAATAERRSERLDPHLQRAIETARERLAPEDFDPTRVRQHVAIGAGVTSDAERRQGLGIAVDNSCAISDQGDDARRLAVGAPGRYCGLRRRGLRRDHDPEDMRRTGRESRSDTRQQIA